MLSNRDQDKIANVIHNLKAYSESNPILSLRQVNILKNLMDELNQSRQSLDSVKRLIDSASIALNDEIIQEAILSTPFGWSVSSEHVKDTRSFMRGLKMFKSPFFLAVWLESLLWFGNINEKAEESLQRWDLDKNVTDLQMILDECKCELELLPKSSFQSLKTNWYRIGFYAVATAGAAIVTEMLSQDDPSQSNLSMLGM